MNDSNPRDQICPHTWATNLTFLRKSMFFYLENSERH